RLRAEYSRALEKTIAENELDVFRAGLDEYEQTDPATIDRLEQRLRTSTEDGLTVVFADLYYEFKGQEAIPLFCEIASKRSVAVRAAIIQLIGEDAIHLAQVQELCLTGLRDPDKSVRTAAARSLLHLPRLAQNENILNAFAETLSQLDEETQEKMVPHMIASNDFYFEMPAIYVLYGWLSDTKIAERRARGLRVLATTGDSKLIGRLSRFLHDRESIVRMQALDLISQLAAHARDRKVRLIGFDTLRNGLKDHDASVRANAVENLQYFEYKLIAPALITAMSDSNFNVRRQACAVTRKIPPDLKRALTGDDPYLAECAAYTLSRARRVRLGKSRAQKRALELCGKILRDIYTLETYRLALESVTAPGARVLDANLEEQTGYLLDRLFWLVSALSDDQAAESVRTALSSPVEQTHINAVETFETITTPRLAKMIAPLYENKSLAALAGIGKVEFGLSAPPFDRVSEFLWPQLETIPAAPNAPQVTPIENADWLAATTIRTLQDLIPARGDDSNQTSQLELPPLEKFRDALEAAAEDERAPLTQEAAHGALRRLESRKNKSRAPTALSVIEKVIALKQVPFFQAMSTEDLRLLAYICDEIRATPNQTIITHGELSDTLYVIVSGKLAVQRTSDGKVGQIAELGVNEFFGELALFDQQPGSADVIALTPTVLLAIRHAPLITMIRNQPDLAINLFQVLTQRLRRLNALISDNDIRARSD
ncbi:MAG: cyclic nucleotide-binding domain-containing protein, partial [Chloroflexi bacterium]|nr:cyclic nucleotide-binding domain-containing protein [Chloroflexota bacterium]